LARRVRWVGACGVLAVLLGVHALYFDYGDRYVHIGAGLVALAVSFRYPRAVTGGLAVWLLLIGGGWAVGRIMYPVPGSLKPGITRAQVHVSLGAPQHSLSSLKMASSIEGYAPPSPWRFPDDVPVEVFSRGHGAVWVFYDGQGRVLNYFSGGS
jgi:hypothetical protein